jgi:hypothetical protein
MHVPGDAAEKSVALAGMEEADSRARAKEDGMVAVVGPQCRLLLLVAECARYW